jgi:Xaa-Pro aminopeptidase
LIELRLRRPGGVDSCGKRRSDVRAHCAGMAHCASGLREAEVRAAMEERIIASGMTRPTARSSPCGEVLHNEQHQG